jgi:hypothetical protein
MQAIVNDVTRRSIMKTLNVRLRALVLPALIAGLGASPVATTAAHAADHPAATKTAAAVVQHVDPVGLFQQRPASGWGPVDQLMDPATSAHKFYQALQQVPGWQDMPVTVAAQTVQGSALPDAYAQHEPAAQAVVNAIAK